MWGGADVGRRYIRERTRDKKRNQLAYCLQSLNMSKPLVLVAGGAGNTGRVVVKNILKEGKFVRPEAPFLHEFCIS